MRFLSFLFRSPIKHNRIRDKLPTGPTKNVGVRIPIDLYNKIGEIAYQQRTSKGAILTWLVIQGMKNLPGSRSKFPPKDI